MINFIRVLGALAEPYMPSFSAKLYEILSITYNDEESKLLRRILSYAETNVENPHYYLIKLALVPEGHEMKESLPLFKKIEASEIAEFKKIFG